ncbi:MAG: 30S ribosome-binding factor RbfA [Gammaproteobacteria bacterium]|nr:30S ribosome-binding factor RbfA [Gammaproteobacteria bacterium]
MPKEYSRSTRVAEQLRRELSELVRWQVKDPRAQDVSVTEVELSKDLAYAKVFFSRLDEDADAIKESTQALNRAAGFLRRELGKSLRMRHVPELRFLYDDSLAKGAHMDALIATARKRDEENSNTDADEESSD